MFHGLCWVPVELPLGSLAWVKLVFGFDHLLFCGYTATKLPKRKKKLKLEVLVNTEKTN